MKACGQAECFVSSSVATYDDGTTDGSKYVPGHYFEALTFGSGKLDDYGFWEFPCGPCARDHEQRRPESGPCWPYERGDPRLKEAIGIEL